MPSVGQSLRIYARFLFRYLLPGSLAFSILPLPESLVMGNNGVPFLAPIAPLILLIASGLVCVVWWILLLLITVIGVSSTLVFGRSVLALSELANNLADTHLFAVEAEKPWLLRTRCSLWLLSAP